MVTVSVRKEEMVSVIQSFLREHGYAVSQKAVSVAFLGPAYSFFSRKLYGIYRRLVQDRPKETIADLAEYGVAVMSLVKPETASAMAQPTAEVIEHVPSAVQPLPAYLVKAKAEFQRANHRFGDCACGYLDPDRQASVCPNCGRPKAVPEPADEVA